MNTEMVDKIIKIGQSRFLKLAAIRTENKRHVPESMRDSSRGERMAPFDVIIAFEDSIGELPHSPKSFILSSNKTDAKGQLEEFLTHLKDQTNMNPHGRIGATITINGQTLGIGIEVQDDEMTIILFDSHGNKINPSKNGFIMILRDIKQAAHTLSLMLYVKNSDMSERKSALARQGFTEKEIASVTTVAKDLNEVSFMVIQPREELVKYPKDDSG